LEERPWQRGGDLLDSDHDPNAVTAAVHDRMPVILDLDSYDLWLDAGLRNVDFVSELLKP
jgi:putative SOS response-associated peptidase YedK